MKHTGDFRPCSLGKNSVQLARLASERLSIVNPFGGWSHRRRNIDVSVLSRSTACTALEVHKSLNVEICFQSLTAKLSCSYIIRQVAPLDITDTRQIYDIELLLLMHSLVRYRTGLSCKVLCKTVLFSFWRKQEPDWLFAIISAFECVQLRS